MTNLFHNSLRKSYGSLVFAEFIFKFIGSRSTVIDFENSLLLIGDFSTGKGINLVKQAIEFIQNTGENIRVSFISSEENYVSRRIFCLSMENEEKDQLSSLSKILNDLSSTAQEDAILKECDNEAFQTYHSQMKGLIKALDLKTSRTYIIFNGRVGLYY